MFTWTNEPEHGSNQINLIFGDILKSVDIKNYVASNMMLTKRNL